MDIKSKKNNSFKKISLDIRTILTIIALFVVMYVLDITGLIRFSSDQYLFTGIFLGAIVILLLITKYYLFLSNSDKKRDSVTILYANLLRSYFHIWRDGIKNNLTLRVAILFILTLFAGISGWEAYSYYSIFTFSWFNLYNALYILIVIPYVFKKMIRFTEILHGTKEIASGNIQHTIDTSGSDTLSDFAGHINNMKIGYQNALENQIKSERLKTELITNVSHDLKTPLTSIINYVNLLKDVETHSPTAQSYIDILDRKSLRLKILIEDLFEVTKISSGVIELDIEYIDVATLLRQAIAEFNFNSEEPSQDIREKIAAPHIYANLDGNRIWRIFENLISNAKKYSLQGTRIYIYLEESNHHVLFKIQNTAFYEIDFDANELLERFKRGDQSRQTDGSGLGLAIVKSIVELHGGEIKIEIHGDQFNVIVNLPKYRH